MSKQVNTSDFDAVKVAGSYGQDYIRVASYPIRPSSKRAFSKNSIFDSPVTCSIRGTAFVIEKVSDMFNGKVVSVTKDKNGYHVYFPAIIPDGLYEVDHDESTEERIVCYPVTSKTS